MFDTHGVSKKQKVHKYFLISVSAKDSCAAKMAFSPGILPSYPSWKKVCVPCKFMRS